MKIEELAAKLNKHLVLTFNPKKEDPNKAYEYVDDLEPWSVRKYDHNNECGRGKTPDEACDALLACMLKRAEEHLLQDTESANCAAERVRELKALIGSEP